MQLFAVPILQGMTGRDDVTMMMMMTMMKMMTVMIMS